MVHCIAFGCNNNDRNTKGKSVSFHRLPVTKPDLLKVWLQRLKLKDPTVTPNVRVCSEHFKHECYERDLSAELLNRKPKIKLKTDAFPTEFCFTKASAPRESSMRRQTLRERQQVVGQLLLEDDSAPLSSTDDMSLDSDSVPASCLEVKVTAERGIQCNLCVPPSVQSPRKQDCITSRDASTQYEDFILLEHSYASSIGANLKFQLPTTGAANEYGLQKSEYSGPEDLDTDSQSDSVHERQEADPEYILPEKMDTESATASEGMETETETDNHCRGGSSVDTSGKVAVKYIVYEENLLQLFKVCSVDGCASAIRKKDLSTDGTLASVSWECVNQHTGKWFSQPYVRRLPSGNLDIAGAVLLSGGSFTEFSDFASILNLCFMSESTFNDIQGSHLMPVIDSEYNRHMASVRQGFMGQAVWAGGDGRCDSPGYSAKYGTYTFMEETTSLIIDSQLVDVTEVSSSNAMELHGFKKGLEHLAENDISIAGVSTDRHPSITAFLKKQEDIEHQFDIWHVAKSVSKKLSAKAKAGCPDLFPWIKSVTHHLWWCCKTCDGSYIILKEKWLSLLHHVSDVHEWASCDFFHKCDHPQLSPEERKCKKWLKPGSKEHSALRDVVMQTRLLNDLKRMTQFKHTGKLEVYHSLLLKYCPKRLHFHKGCMQTRIQLSVMDHNNNLGRQQATTKDGTPRYNAVFRKDKKEWRAKKIYTQKSYAFKNVAMKKFIEHRLTSQLRIRDRPLGTQSVKNIATAEKPDKDVLIEKQKCRF